MRILFIAGTFPQLTFIFRTVVTIAKEGHEVVVMAREPGSWKAFESELPLPANLTVKYLIPDSRLLNPGRLLRLLRVSFSRILRSPVGAFKLARLCFQRAHNRRYAAVIFFRHLPFLGAQADIVQFEFSMMKTLYPLVETLVKAPTIVSCRGSDVHTLEIRKARDQKRRLESLLSPTLVHCVSEEMTQAVTQISGRTDGLWVNRPAIPVQQIIPKQTYSTNPVPMIVTVGRLNWKKGFDYFLAALTRLKDAGVPFKAQIIGSGELQAQMRFSVQDLDLTEEVELVGRVKPEKVFDYLHQADIYILSSHEEGISNAVLEAMAAGLPIVTTSAGGMAEAVRDGVDGYVIPVRDIPAMVEKLTTLLGDGQLRERMGRSARERVEAEFTLERQAKVFGQMYEAAQLQHKSIVTTTS